MRDYYEILGVEKDADDATLKKAYRRLARKYHPDKNPDDASAEDNFKEMKEAYDVLSDPKKRQAYDQFGTPDMNMGFGNASTTGDVNIDDILRRMREAGMNPDIGSYQTQETVQKIQIPVETMINGGRATFRYMNPQQSGNMFTFNHNIGNMDLKPNTRVGTRVQSSSIPNTTFVLLPQGHQRCIVQGIDLVVPMDVNALSAAVGNKERVLHPSGKSYEVAIPPGAKNGAGIRLAGLGLTHVNGAVGNLIAVVNYIVPKLDKETQKALRELLEKA